MVVSTGLEPVTSSMSRRRATNCAKRPYVLGIALTFGERQELISTQLGTHKLTEPTKLSA